MTDIYFPSCNYSRYSPTNSRKIQNYLSSRHNLKITSCCSLEYQQLTAENTAVFVCPTCAAILRESAPQADLISIWQFLLKDENFLWPDYHGEVMSVQDCWRSCQDVNLHNAVRKIMQKCRINSVEIEENRQQSRFCGITLLKPPSPRYHKLAPKYFIENAKDIFTPCDEAEQTQRMLNHCRQFKTEKVICYCTGCLEGLQKGGKNAVHLMDIIADHL